MHDITSSFDVIKVDESGFFETKVQVCIENTYSLLVNGELIVRLSLSPTDLIAYAAGYLICEGLIDNYSQIEKIDIIDELKKVTKTIVFIDEVHTLIGGTGDGPMDLANMLKPCLDRGEVKAIGATTTQEYETYVIRDRAFLRRFDRIDVSEPDQATTVKILMGSLPRIEKQTGVKFKYSDYITSLLITEIVSATSEYKRVYGLAAMYPDVSFSVLTQAFSLALLNNKTEVDVLDVYNAIKGSKRIYPDVIVKQLAEFKVKFAQLCGEEGIILPDVMKEDIDNI